MELVFQIKNLRHSGMSQSAFSKTAYIDRDCYRSYYDGRLYDYEYKTKKDLVYTETLCAKGMNQSKSFVEILNEYETDKITLRYDSKIGREFVINLDNRFIVKDESGYIDKEASEIFIKDYLNDFFQRNFVSKGFAVHYAVHCPQKDESDNYHLHAIVLENLYDEKNKKWIKNLYYDEDNKRRSHNELDDRSKSGKRIRELRKDISDLQNKLLKEMGYKDSFVEYQSYKNRGLNKCAKYKLSLYHHKELESLKSQYSYIDDVIERNNKILEDRKGKLTKKQIHNLKAEIYNELNKKNENKEYTKEVNKAIENAFENKAKGFVNHTSNIIFSAIQSAVANSNNQAKKGHSRGM